METTQFADRRLRCTRDSQEANIRIGIDIALTVLRHTACEDRAGDLPRICLPDVNEFYEAARAAINREWKASYSLEYGKDPSI